MSLPQWVRRPTKIEISLQILLGLLLLMSASDYFLAREATSCFIPRPSPRCYPWGMTEGPMEGGSWSYMNKEDYLLSSVGLNLVLLASLFVPFFCRGPWSGVLLTLGFFLGGNWIVDYALQRFATG